MTFIQYLIKYCKEHYITAYELSKKSGVSMTYCYRLLSGRMTNPSLKVIKQLSKALDIEYAGFIKDMEV